MKVLDRLIEILCSERGAKPLSVTENKKQDNFRALVNVRPPLPASDEFLTLQDEYLTALNQNRGVLR